MIILGLDPGTATTGFAIVEKNRGRLTALDYGVITTSAKLSLPKRLQIIADDLQELIKKYKPNLIVVESLFFFKNQKTVFAVAQARGAILLVASASNAKIKEITPLQVKQAISGYGRADKKQVQKMVQAIYQLAEIPHPDDAADALAIAYAGS